MGGRPSNWGALELRRKAADGQLEGVRYDDENPLRALFVNGEASSKRLEHYLATSPRGERDVGALVEGLAAQGREREEWLRGVLEGEE